MSQSVRPIHRRSTALLLLLAAWLLLLPVLAAHAQQLQTVPTLTAPLIDQTGTLSTEQTQTITARLRSIEETSGAQIVVLMVPTTQPEDIAGFAHRVADTWKIGRKDVGDGLLVLIATHDRRMRIEVSRALEGAIPDLAASRIIEQQMAPHFRQGDYASGILASLDHIAARIAGEQLPPPSNTARSKNSNWEDLAIFLFFGVMVIGPAIRRMFGNKIGALIVGGGTGTLTFFITSSLLLGLGAGVVALLITLLSNSKGGGGKGGGGPYISTGSWGGRSGGFGGGGFRSGGGGSFGGGGASGSW